MRHRFIQLSALLGLAALSQAAALEPAPFYGTAAGTVISNTAFLDSIDDAGTKQSQTSNTVGVTVQHVPALSVPQDTTGTGTCGQTVIGLPGQLAVIPYTLTNTSNGTDTYNVSVLAGNGNTDASLAKVYQDNGDNTFNGADRLLPPGITLASGENTTVFVVYPIPTNSASSTVYSLNPQFSSAANPFVQDTNNLGCADTQDVLGVGFTGNRTGTATSPGSVTYTHTISNTGNTPLTTSNLALDLGTKPGGWTYAYTVGGAASGTTPAAALANWNGTLAPGTTLPVTVTVTSPNGLSGGTTDTTSLAARTTTASSAAVNNTTSTPIQVEDTTTILKGVAGITKSVQTCGTDATCAAPTAVTGNRVIPKEVLRYTVTGSNLGNGTLKRPVLRDALAADLTSLSWTASITGQTGGKLMFSLDNATWAALPQNVADQSGLTLYVGYDSNGDDTVDDRDVLNPAAVMSLTITTKVK